MREQYLGGIGLEFVFLDICLFKTTMDSERSFFFIYMLIRRVWILNPNFQQLISPKHFAKLMAFTKSITLAVLYSSSAGYCDVAKHKVSRLTVRYFQRNTWICLLTL